LKFQLTWFWHSW